jgi:hypothetical protein
MPSGLAAKQDWPVLINMAASSSMPKMVCNPAQSAPLHKTSTGAYWFGGDRGLSYYVPEQGRPWIQLSGIDGGDVKVSDERWQVLAGEPIEVNFNYGDLQTRQRNYVCTCA